MLLEPPTPSHPRPNLRAIFNSNPPHSDGDDSTQQHHPSNATWQHNNNNNVNMSPLNNQLLTLSPLTKSPWHNHSNNNNQNGLVGSITREEGHVYSLAVSGDLLYTGSESKNIRVWKNLKDHAGFKSSSGLVKSIVISVSKEKIFTGHQDGKIRIWKVPKEDQSSHKRIGTMPSFKDYVKRRVRRHYDAVSSLSLDEECGLLYSASWDKTVRVWSAWDFKWLETIEAHADAVNAVVAGFEGRVFTGSADGTVKVWRREEKQQERVRHVLEGVLLEGESAVTALAVKRWCRVVYGGCSDGVVRFWERKKSGTVWKWNGGVLRGHERAVLCVGVAGRLVLSGSGDMSVHVWKREESGVHVWLCVLAGHTGPVKCVAAVEEEKGDGKCMVYTGSVDGSVKVWRVYDNAPGLRVCGSGLRLPPVMEWKKDVKWKHQGWK